MSGDQGPEGADDAPGAPSRRAVSVGRALAAFAALMALWLVLSGHYEFKIVLFGVLSAMFVVAMTMRVGALDEEGAPLTWLPSLVTYWPWLGREIVIANLDVAKAILRGPEGISPVVIRAPMDQRTDAGRVVYANSITLTPGTVSIEIENDAVLVHALTDAMADGLMGGEMNRRVCVAEGRGGGAL